MVERALAQRIAAGVDLRDQVPDLKLRPKERVVDIQRFSPQPPRRHLSALRAMMDLTAAPRVSEIGLHGPSNAASVTEANKDIAELGLYSAFFPRDAHVVAKFLRRKFPGLTKATILQSVTFTGVRENLRSIGPKDEQEAWKVPHEIRDDKTDPIAQRLSREKDWGWPYYGAVDTTGKNVEAITYVALLPNNLSFLQDQYTGLDGKRHTMEDALQGHINWIRKRMGFNDEGLVEALWMNPKHHANQTWADVSDSFHHADGSWAEHHPERNWGVASVEVHAEIHDALVGTVDVYRALAADARPDRKKYLEDEIQDLTTRADHLREVILSKFWVEDENHHGGFFARGTDRDDTGNLRPLAIRSSDMGHLLNSRVLDGDDPEVVVKREAVIRNLFSPEMLCPNGIRTLSSDSVRYWKYKYHNGNSWPWVTYYIALGLQRHEYFGLSYELKKRAWSVYKETKILPEYATGDGSPQDRLVNRKVVIYDPTVVGEPLHQITQPPQEIQAWTAAAILAIKQEQGDRIFRPQIAVPTQALDPHRRALEQEILTSLQ